MMKKFLKILTFSLLFYMIDFISCYPVCFVFQLLIVVFTEYKVKCHSNIVKSNSVAYV